MNNSVQTPLNIGTEEGDQPGQTVHWSAAPPPWSAAPVPNASELQPAPAPSAPELESISGDETQSPSPSPPPPPQSSPPPQPSPPPPPSLQSENPPLPPSLHRNPTPPPPGEEDTVVYNIPLPNQVVSIRLPRSVGHPQVEVIYRNDKVRDSLCLLHSIIPKTMHMTNLIMHSENCPHELFPKFYSIRYIARQLEVVIPTLIDSVNLNDENAYILAINAYDQLQKMFINLHTAITNIYRESRGMN